MMLFHCYDIMCDLYKSTLNNKRFLLQQNLSGGVCIPVTNGPSLVTIKVLAAIQDFTTV